MSDSASEQALTAASERPWEYTHKAGGERPDGSEWGAIGMWSTKGLVFGSGEGWDGEFEEPTKEDQILLQLAVNYLDAFREAAVKTKNEREFRDQSYGRACECGLCGYCMGVNALATLEQDAMKLHQKVQLSSSSIDLGLE